MPQMKDTKEVPDGYDDSGSETSNDDNVNIRPRRVRRFDHNFFDVNVSERVFREKHRVSPVVLEDLVNWIGPELSRRNRRGLPFTPKQRIQIFLHFLGTNGFYHEVGSCHLISRSAVGTIVREVAEVLFSHRNEVIRWPDNPEKLAEDFHRIQRIPCVAGTIDGCHIPIQVPKADEASFINRKQFHSINALVVAGTIIY